MNRFSIRSSVQVVLLVLTLFLLISLGGSWWSAVWANRSFAKEHHAYEESLRPMAALETAIWRARFNVLRANRDVVIGKLDQVDVYLTQTENDLQEAKQQADLVVQYAERNNQSVQLANDIKKLIDEYSLGINVGIKGLRAGDVSDYADAWSQKHRNDILTEFFEKYKAIEAESNRLSDAAMEGFDEYQKIVQWGGSLLVGLALLLCLVFWRYLRARLFVPLQETVELLEKVAEGDLSSRIEAKTNNEIGQLTTALRKMQDGLVRMVNQVRQGVAEINTGAQEIAAGNSDLSSRTEQQAASLEETAASMEQLASTVKQNADNARLADQLGSGGKEVAQRGGVAVDEVVTTMAQISESSKKISEIVNVIDGIAFQTNILALNAAVEAARAGEQGKGFAVVAGEVRALAQRSAQAAKEIKELISDSANKVGAGSEQVGRAGATMREIVASAQRVTDIMAEIAAASQEQSAGIEQVNQAVMQMDQATQQNAALVEESAAAASSLENQARQLQSSVSRFRLAAGDVIDVPAQHVAPPLLRKSTAALQGQKKKVAESSGRALPAVRASLPSKVAHTSGAIPSLHRPKAVAAPAPSRNEEDWTHF